jgi:hypothetical protein
MLLLGAIFYSVWDRLGGTGLISLVKGCLKKFAYLLPNTIMFLELQAWPWPQGSYQLCFLWVLLLQDLKVKIKVEVVTYMEGKIKVSIQLCFLELYAYKQ